MCFSSNASFSSGALLIGIGILSIKKTQHASQLLFACIPFIFGVQQIAEGILWLSIDNPNYILTKKVVVYIFLFFAQVLWPIWVPIALLHLEKKDARKKIHKCIAIAGISVGIYLAYCLCIFPVAANNMGRHINYILDFPKPYRYYVIVIYSMATIAPLFFSSIKGVWVLGTIILLSYIATIIFYNYYIISVWCFFSSIISIYIYVILSKSKNTVSAG